MSLSLLAVIHALVVAVPVATAQHCYDFEVGKVRVLPGNNTVEVCRHISYYSGNSWSKVCGYDWDCREATVACREFLGIDNPRAIPSTVYSYNYYSYYSHNLPRYTCSGNEHSLSQCSNYISHCHYIARVVCIAPNGCPQHGRVRLVDGEGDSAGRLELCYKGEWSPFSTTSGFGYNEGAAACRHLGFLQYPRVITDGRYDTSDYSYTWFTRIVCDGDEETLMDCDVYNTSNTCSQQNRALTQVGLQCFRAPPTPQCTHGSARLVGGRIEQEGRVEVCINGVWGSVCRAQFKISDVYVLCSQLGYHGPSDRFIDSREFGYGDGPIFRGFDCDGWEQDIGECFNSTQQYEEDYNMVCNWDNTAAVRCSDFCHTGDVQLVGGPNGNSGIVEYCENYMWGLIAEPGWSDTDAAVVCKQLGFSEEGAVAVHNASSLYTRPKRLIHMANMFCTGEENSISKCASYHSSHSDGIEWMKKLEVAGVVCQSTTPPITPPIAPPITPPDAPPVARYSSILVARISSTVTCHSSSTPVVRPSAPVKERHYSTAPAVQQSKPVPLTTNPVSNAVSDISSQQMIMTVLESSVATAIFMGLIFLLLLVVLASVAIVTAVRCMQRRKIERLSWEHIPAEENI